MRLLLFSILLFFLGLTNVNSQNSFNLQILKSSEAPTNSYEHFYLFELENNASSSQSFVCNIENTSCEIDEHPKHSKFNIEFYDLSKRNKISEINIQGNQSKTFYVRVSIPKNTNLSTWNCSTVKVSNSINSEIQKVNLVSSLQDITKAE